MYVDDYQCVPGLWRLWQFIPDHFYLGEYYLTYYQQTGLAEEVAFFSTSAAVLSLMRSTASCAFSRDEQSWGWYLK